MLRGLVGTILNIGAGDMVAVDAKSVVSGPHGPLLDRQGVPFEDPQELVVTFTSFQASTAFTNATAKIEFGSGGSPGLITPIRFYAGLQIPIKASWARVTFLGSAFPYTAGAQVAYGHCEPGIVQLATTASAPLTTESETFEISPFVRAYKVIKSDLSVQLDVLYPSDVLETPVEAYSLAAGSNDVWHPRILVPGQPSNTIDLINTGAVAGQITVLGLLGS